MKLQIKEYLEINESIQDIIAEQLYKFWITEYHDANINSKEDLVIHLRKEIYKCFVFLDTSEEFVGTVCVNTDTGKTIKFNTNFFICNLFVAESHRKEGHGKYILSYAEDYLRKHGHSTVTLYCKKDVYEFYKKQQYQDFGICPKDETLTCMMKFLDCSQKFL